MTAPLERNLVALSRIDAALAARIRSVPDAAPLAQTPSGKRGLSVRGEEGAQAILPLDGEAKGGVEGDPDAVLFLGAGMTLLALQAAREARRGMWIFVIEPAEELFRSLLTHVDFEDLFLRDRFRLYVHGTESSVAPVLRDWLEDAGVVEVAVQVNPRSRELFPRRFLPVERDADRVVLYKQCSETTLLGHAERISRNAIRNLPWARRSAGVADFAGRGAGMPALVVAAGPSLEGKGESLRRLASGAMLISAGKSLGYLLERGIAPAFVCHLDFDESTRRCFEGREIPAETTLVWDPESAPEVVESFPGDRITYESGAGWDVWGGAFWGPKGELPSGMSVAHTAFHFARLLGADPIVLVGVDLAFPGSRTHAEGVTMTWGGDVASIRDGFVEVPSVRGGTVPTLPAFQAFRDLFEREIEGTRARVINTSEIGARIRGAESISLDAVAPVRIDFGARKRTALERPRRFHRESFRRASEELLASAARIEEHAREGEEELKDPPFHDRARFSEAARRIEVRRRALLEERNLTILLRRYLAKESARIRRIDRAWDRSAGEDVIGRNRLEAERLALLFSGYRRAVRFLLDEFPAARDRLLRDDGDDSGT